MSNAPRPATWNSRSRSWAGQDRVLGQRMSASPSFSGRSGGAARRALGRHHERALGAVAQVDDRADDLGDHVAGLAQHHGVADEHALALDLGGVVQRRQLDGRAADEDRLHHAVRRDPAGAADVDPDVEQLGGDLLGRVLERDRPARRPRRRPEPALHRHLVDLDDDAVDLVLDVVPVLAVVVDVRLHAGQVVDDLEPVADRQAPGARSASYASDCRAALKPSRAPTPCTTIRSGRLAVTRGSFCRSEPAAALRGLANGALPASTSAALSSAKPATGKNTSPRTSSSAGTSVAGEPARARRRGCGR